MRQVGGIFLPDDAVETVRKIKQDGRPAKLFLPDAGTSDQCENCNGSGVVTLEELISPHDSPTNFLHPTVPYQGRWWTFKAYTWPCPICHAGLADRIALLWEMCGLEQAERDWHVDYIDGMLGKTSALKAVRDTLSMSPNPTGWLVLFGPYGVGKSGVLKSLVAGFVRAGVSARYVRAGDVLAEIRDTYGDDSRESEMELRRRYSACRLLAIDELDRIPDTKWAQTTFAALMDDRYNARFRAFTIMATNARPDGLGPEMGYLESRLQDAQRIPVGGQDLRAHKIAS